MTEPEIYQNALKAGTPRVSVYFYKVGTATASVYEREDGSLDIRWECWVPYDPDEDKRGYGFADFGPDGSARITIPTSYVDQAAGGLTLDEYYAALNAIASLPVEKAG